MAYSIACCSVAENGQFKFSGVPLEMIFGYGMITHETKTADCRSAKKSVFLSGELT